MKKNLSILFATALLVIAQACGSKSENTSDDTTLATEDTVAAEGVKAPEMTLEEKRANIEKERVARMEKRKLEWDERAKTTPSFKDKNGKTVYYRAETQPEFAGGEDAMNKYLQDNLTYPETARDAGTEGTVFVEFVIAADGTVRDVEVTDATSDDATLTFKEEAARIVAAMPKWKPGRQGGKPVDVKFTLPVTFRLS